MPIVPIRSDNAYVGAAVQTIQGSPVAPDHFFRWLDGSKLEYDMKVEEVWEGDGTRRLSQSVKQYQLIKATVKLNPRPIEIGFLEAAALGAGADTLSAATVATTVSTGSSAGATSLTIASNSGFSGSGTITLVVGAGTANEEIAVFALPVTGAGPYTITVSNSKTLKNAHNAGEIVRVYSLHTLSDQTDGNYYTWEFGLGSLSGATGPTIRVTDCKVEQVKREAKAGGLLEYEVSILGIGSALQNSPATVTYENHQAFLYSQTYGGWTLNGSTTGDAVAIQSFTITQKNGIGTDIQAEQLTLAALIFGNIDLDVKLDLIMQNSTLIALTYYNGGTTDAQAIGSGNVIIKFTQPDGFHSVQYTIPTTEWHKTKMPEPKKDGKHFKLEIEGKAVSNQSQNPYLLQVALQNTLNTSY